MTRVPAREMRRIMREAGRTWIVFLIFLSGVPVRAQKELKRWLAGQRFERRESLAWTDRDGRNLSTLPAASV
jgi:hypothetical protein